MRLVWFTAGAMTMGLVFILGWQVETMWIWFFREALY